MAALESTQKLAFRARLERIATTAEYFAFKVPPEVTAALGIRGPVPVTAVLNGKTTFMVSLAPLGGGRHLMRVNVNARTDAGIQEGDLVSVEITVHQHSTKMPIPPDLREALRAEGVLAAFESMTLGKRKMLIGWVNGAAKPETRDRRVQGVVAQAHEQREKLHDRQARAAKRRA